MAAAGPLVVPAPDLSTFGRRLAYIRWYVGLAREAMIKRLDIDATQGSWANWEKDRPCDSKAEVAAAIEREFPEFPAMFVLYGHAELAAPVGGPSATGDRRLRRSAQRVTSDSPRSSRYTSAPISPISTADLVQSSPVRTIRRAA